MKNKIIETVEIGRGFASILVVLFHSTEIINLKKGCSEVFKNFWIFGHAGVDFFFVLSGFVIYLSGMRLLEKKGRNGYARYIKARISRIYPPYLIICFLLLPLVIFFYKIQPSLVEIIKDLALYPKKSTPFLPIAWSLKHEIFFYLLFSVFFIQKRIGWLIFFFWGICIIFINTLNLNKLSSPEFLLIFNDFNLEFLLGMFIGKLYLKNFNFNKIFFYIGIFLFFATGINECINTSWRYIKYYHILYGIGSMLIIMGLLDIEKKFQYIKSPFKSFFLTLGKASYSIYLVHFTFLIISVRIFIYLFNKISPEIIFLIVAPSAIFCGYLYWKFIETPSINFCKKKIFKIN